MATIVVFVVVVVFNFNVSVFHFSFKHPASIFSLIILGIFFSLYMSLIASLRRQF